jgi:hypothetical protein
MAFQIRPVFDMVFSSTLLLKVGSGSERIVTQLSEIVI